MKRLKHFTVKQKEELIKLTDVNNPFPKIISVEVVNEDVDDHQPLITIVVELKGFPKVEIWNWTSFGFVRDVELFNSVDVNGKLKKTSEQYIIDFIRCATEQFSDWDGSVLECLNVEEVFKIVD